MRQPNGVGYVCMVLSELLLADSLTANLVAMAGVRYLIDDARAIC